MARGLSERKMRRMARKADVAGLTQAARVRELKRMATGSMLDVTWERRAASLRALAELEDPEAEQALISALDDPVPPVRQTAVDQLSARATATALPELAYRCATWSDPADEIRIGALGRLRERADVPVARRYVEGLLGADSPFPPDEQDEATILEFVDADPAIMGELVALLVEQLGSVDRERTRRAEQVLGLLGDPAVPAVEDAARLDGAGAGAARVLAQIGEERSLDTLKEILAHGATAEERREAALALTALRTPLAIEPLMHATRDAKRIVRDAALAGLDSYGTMATVAMIGDVVRPGLDAVLELGRPSAPPPSPVALPEAAPTAAPADGWRGRVIGLLSRGSS